MELASSATSSLPPHAIPVRARSEWLWIALLSLAALVPRLVGLDFLLVHYPDHDAVYALQPKMIRGEVWHPWYAAYPLMVGQALLQIPSDEDDVTADDPLETRLDHARATFMRPRVVVALVSTLAVPATYWLARAFFGIGWSALAALFVATSGMHLNYSQQGRPHSAITALIALTIVASLTLARHGRWRDWLLASVLGTLSIGMLHSGLAGFLSLAVAGWLAPKPRRAIERLKWLLPLAGIVFALLVFYPYLLPGKIEQWGRVSDDTAQLGSHYVRFSKFDGGGFVTLAWGLIGHDPVMTLLAVVGASLGIAHLIRLRKRRERLSADLRRDLLVVGVFAVPYALVFGSFSGTLDRFVAPLVPVTACFAVVAAAWLARTIARRLPSLQPRFVGLAVATLCLALPIYASARLVQLRASPDTIELAAAWVHEHVDPAKHVWMQPEVDLPVAYSQAALDGAEGFNKPVCYYWLRAQKRVPVESDVRFDVRNLPRYEDAFWEDLKGPKVDELLAPLRPGYFVCLVPIESIHAGKVALLRDALQKRGELVFALEPLGPPAPSEGMLLYQPASFLLQLLSARHIGPTVEIYRLDG
ncbi:MAG: glycosyltransferase family 39 protein [Planctomycetes bacterium]|nr:glycosyltransferase family 39 protein [Planctomycetota bacterium]